mmetsp:Transcript_27936/g.58999  ORF Transcript_27936/g.58999 Transcript_27936/m.58999 type:complete len:223 (-) Transcript_27936:50-718(-)
MGVSMADHSSIALERSLHKAFSAIHRSPLSSDVRGSSPSNLHDCSLKRDRRGRALPKKKATVETEALPSLPFDRDTSPQQSRESSQERPVRKFQRRRRTVTFDPSTKFPAPSSTNDAQQQQPAEEQQQQRVNGLRGDYFIGDKLRSPCHMIDETTDVGSLNRHDFAFVKRSDGSYSYAILAFRTNNDAEESMVFVMSDDGCTKSIREKHWAKLIRLVSKEES